MVMRLLSMQCHQPNNHHHVFESAENIWLSGHFREFPHAPKRPLNSYGEDAGVRYLIMERMKCDLEQQCSESGGCIAASTIAAYGLQILDGLEWMHRKGFGFVDVKPQNFMLDSSGQVKFIDYGLIERLVSSAAGGVRDGTAVCAEPQGTPTFSSVAVDNGAVPSPKDDIEAMVCDCNHMI